MSTEYEDAMARIANDLQNLVNEYEQACESNDMRTAKDLMIDIGTLAILFHEEFENGIRKLKDWE